MKHSLSRENYNCKELDETELKAFIGLLILLTLQRELVKSLEIYGHQDHSVNQFLKQLHQS